MATLVMMVGLPASGKSTFAQEIVDMGVCEKIHSSDEIRKELFGDVNSQESNAEVFDLLHQRIKSDLKNDISCVYDATNIKSSRRVAFLVELGIEKIYCDKICVYANTPYSVCIKMNEKRSRKIPVDVIKKMRKDFETPHYYEGWNKIYRMKIEEEQQ